MLDQYQLDVNRAMLRKNTYFDRNYFRNLGARRQRLIEIIELLKLIKVEIRKTPAIKADENEDSVPMSVQSISQDREGED